VREVDVMSVISVLVLDCHIEMNIIMKSGVCCTSGSGAVRLLG
jgi:hypothetical protein